MNEGLPLFRSIFSDEDLRPANIIWEPNPERVPVQHRRPPAVFQKQQKARFMAGSGQWLVAHVVGKTADHYELRRSGHKDTFRKPIREVELLP